MVRLCLTSLQRKKKGRREGKEGKGNKEPILRTETKAGAFIYRNKVSALLIKSRTFFCNVSALATNA
jgi:hypothetical protein